VRGTLSSNSHLSPSPLLMLLFFLLRVSVYGTLTQSSEGVYGLTAWSVLNLDCEQWGCTNELWPVGGIFQKVTADCKPVDVTFLGDDVKVTKVQG
jgi:hypothetical protein